MISKFYVYHLIDPTNNIVFYVGKGRNRRMFMHEYFVRTDRKFDNMHLFNKIKKLLKGGINVVYKKVLETDDEDLALRKEREHIASIGRADLNLGPLCNMTDGGEKNFNISEVTRAKLRYPKTDGHRKKLSIALTGKIKTPATCQALRNRTIKNGWFYRKDKHHNEATKTRISEKKKGKTWEEIYGVEEANRRREQLKQRHQLGLMKTDSSVLSNAQKENWVRRKQLGATLHG